MHGGGGHGGHSSYYEDELKTKILWISGSSII